MSFGWGALGPAEVAAPARCPAQRPAPPNLSYRACQYFSTQWTSSVLEGNSHFSTTQFTATGQVADITGSLAALALLVAGAVSMAQWSVPLPVLCWRGALVIVNCDGIAKGWNRDAVMEPTEPATSWSWRQVCLVSQPGTLHQARPAMSKQRSLLCGLFCRHRSHHGAQTRPCAVLGHAQGGQCRKRRGELTIVQQVLLISRCPVRAKLVTWHRELKTRSRSSRLYLSLATLMWFADLLLKPFEPPEAPYTHTNQKFTYFVKPPSSQFTRARYVIIQPR